MSPYPKLAVVELRPSTFRERRPYFASVGDLASKPGIEYVVVDPITVEPSMRAELGFQPANQLSHLSSALLCYVGSFSKTNREQRILSEGLANVCADWGIYSQSPHFLVTASIPNETCSDFEFVIKQNLQELSKNAPYPIEYVHDALEKKLPEYEFSPIVNMRK